MRTLRKHTCYPVQNLEVTSTFYEALALSQNVIFLLALPIGSKGVAWSPEAAMVPFEAQAKTQHESPCCFSYGRGETGYLDNARIKRVKITRKLLMVRLRHPVLFCPQLERTQVSLDKRKEYAGIDCLGQTIVGAPSKLTPRCRSTRQHAQHVCDILKCSVQQNAQHVCALMCKAGRIP